MVDWNDGMECDDHANLAHYDDIYPLCLGSLTKKQQVGKPAVSKGLKKAGSI